MKPIGAILAMCGCVFGAWAQTPSAPVVIKDECPWVLGLKFSSNGSDLARFCFGYATVLLDARTYSKARMLLIEQSTHHSCGRWCSAQTERCL
jgi:hypothetical protein